MLYFSQRGRCMIYGVVFTDKVLLNFFQNIRFSLLKSFNLSIWIGADNFLDFFIKKFPIDQRYFIINPITPFLMECLDYSVIFFIASLMIVLEEIYQISPFKVTAYPIFFDAVFKNTVSLEYIALKLTGVRVSIFEYFLTKAIKLAVYVISSFNKIELEIVLILLGLNTIMTR